ncbi:MAG: hypothetical protein K2H16_06625 [Prevotella sp.]|nr:hypothetical protein [Prevotella sp.]MDE6152092.1 hypothetical protein [Prevotella sp.]
MILIFLSVKDMDGRMWDCHNAVYSNQAVSVIYGYRLILFCQKIDKGM